MVKFGTMFQQSSYEKTKRVSDVYVLNVGNHKIKLWGKNNFKDYVSDNKTLLFNNYIPISIVLEKREEVIVKETIYTEDEAVSEALKLVEKGMKDKNDKIEGVKEIKILNKEFGGNTVKLKLFVSVNENITGKQEIREEDLIKEKEASQFSKASVQMFLLKLWVPSFRYSRLLVVIRK